MTHEQILEQSRKDLKAIYKQAKEKLAKLETGIVAQVGKWYKDPSSDYLVHVTKILGNNNYVEVYGFGSNGSWFNKWDTVVHQLCVEATPQEVEKALIEEAKRRGVTPYYDTFHFEHKLNILYDRFGLGQEVIFSNGNWATIIEQDKPTEVADKFAELKEAHRNGKVIELWSDIFDKWMEVTATFDLWIPTRKYRIKPEERPKVGDVCKFWDDDENAFVVAIYTELREDNQWDDTSFTHPHGVRVAGNYYTRFYKNAKALDPQQVQDLLFPNKQEF